TGTTGRVPVDRIPTQHVLPEREHSQQARHGARGAGTRAPGTGSDPATLGRTATVVRNRGDVLNGADLQAGRLQRTDGGLPARPRALHEHVHLTNTVLLGTARGGLGGHLSGVRGRLTRTLEADLTGAGPRDHCTVR